MNTPFDPVSPPLCDLCKAAPAAIQFVEQRGNETRKISICHGCAAKQGISHNGSSLTFNLPSILAAMSSLVEPEEDVVCSFCGLTGTQFRENGRLGCAQCYEVFEEILKPIIKRTQSGMDHRGLVPARLAPSVEKAEIIELRKKMEELVKAERYEEAARLRDKIKELEISLGAKK